MRWTKVRELSTCRRWRMRRRCLGSCRPGLPGTLLMPESAILDCDGEIAVIVDIATVTARQWRFFNGSEAHEQADPDRAVRVGLLGRRAPRSARDVRPSRVPGRVRHADR